MVRSGRTWAAISAFVVSAALVVVESGCERASSQQATPPAGDSIVTHDPGSPGWGYHGGSSAQGYSPQQPINFPHPKHVKGLGMNCVYCHYSAYKSPDPGLPAVGTCMGCHLYAFTLAKKSEIVKLNEYWTKKQPVPWVRIHKLPEYVHFPHMRHVNAGVTCQTCHGQVQEMYRVYQYASLNMGWCINCHVNGYNPVDGDRAAGSARELGPPGASSQPNLSPPRGQQTSTTGAQTATAAGLSIGPPLTDSRHRARYDCSTCHY